MKSGAYDAHKLHHCTQYLHQHPPSVQKVKHIIKRILIEAQRSCMVQPACEHQPKPCLGTWLQGVQQLHTPTIS